MSLYLGLMSGTSMDGIDAVLLAVEPDRMRVRAASQRRWGVDLQARLRRAAEHPDRTGLTELGTLDVTVGREFALAARELMTATGVDRTQITAVGSHGQTVLHWPRGNTRFTLQIGDPNIIAEELGIDVVGDFRRRDMAAGGEGAPLMSAFHLAAFGAPGEQRTVVNIGGIANATLLTAGNASGFDTGPGNCLLDSWARRQRGMDYDRHGAWAATGTVSTDLLARMLTEPYFAMPTPKSTGRDLFSDEWLDRMLGSAAGTLAAADVQATLAELTAVSIAAALEPAPAAVVVCGGGAYNDDLMRRLARMLPVSRVTTTAEFGIAPEHVEGAGFAWLAHRYVHGLTGNLPSVTGARHSVPLGALYRGKSANPGPGPL